MMTTNESVAMVNLSAAAASASASASADGNGYGDEVYSCLLNKCITYKPALNLI